MRFFGFGCSFTNYHYPTWADILIENFSHNNIEGYNCGRTGSGNLLIASRIWEAHARLKFNKDDLIIICWSNFFREDRYHTNDGWWTPGNIFFNLTGSPFLLNKYVYKSDYIWADLLHYVTRDCMIITSTLEGLKQTGAQIVSTGIMDPFEDEQLLEFENIKEIFDTYKKWLKPDVTPIMNYCWYEGVDKDKTRPYYSNKSDPTTNIIEDHPIPLEYLSYVEDIISPYINIKIDSDTKDWAKKWQTSLYNNNGGFYPLKNWHPKELKWLID